MSTIQHDSLPGEFTDSGRDGKSSFSVDAHGGGVPAEAPGHLGGLHRHGSELQTNVGPGEFVRYEDLQLCVTWRSYRLFIIGGSHSQYVSFS